MRVFELKPVARISKRNPPIIFLVTTGLDPVVHAEVRLSMDCRVFARQ